ncbi:MAG: ATP-binding cassette domain-containing protein [Ardenticatenales bacterium]
MSAEGAIEPAIVADGLTFRYPGASRDALVNVDIRVDRGAAHVIAGANGSGRTTLLGVLAGQLHGGSGGRLRGRVTGAATSALVPSDPYLAQSGVRASVRAELAFGLECRAQEPRRIHERVAAALRTFGLDALAERDPSTLSGGEAARLAVAAQWVVAPVTLLVDDLAAQLDRAGTLALRRCLAEHVAAGGAAIWATTRLDGPLEAAGRVDSAGAGVGGRDESGGSGELDGRTARGAVAPAADVDPRPGTPFSPHAPPSCDITMLVGGRVAAGGPLARRADDPRLAPWGIIPAAGPRALVAPAAAPADGGAVDMMRPTVPAALTIESLTAGYPDAPSPALHEATLTVQPGEIVALVGPNGGGKSTLARTAVGLLPPTSGLVRVGDRRFDAHANAVGPARGAALAMQRPERMIFRRRADEEVAIGLRWLGVPPAERAALVAAALAGAGLAGRAADHPHDLLPSQRRWLALAAVVALRTPVLVLDEPTAGFDAFDLIRFSVWLATLRAAGRAVLWITHDRALASILADRTVRLAGGRVVADERDGGANMEGGV